MVEGENEPCIGPGKVIHAHHPEREKLASHFVKAAWTKRGLVGWVERACIIRPIDTVKGMLPTPVTYSLPPAAKGAG